MASKEWNTGWAPILAHGVRFGGAGGSQPVLSRQKLDVGPLTMVEADGNPTASVWGLQSVVRFAPAPGSDVVRDDWAFSLGPGPSSVCAPTARQNCDTYNTAWRFTQLKQLIYCRMELVEATIDALLGLFWPN